MTLSAAMHASLRSRVLCTVLLLLLLAMVMLAGSDKGGSA
jgi:hypothetical protein